MSLKCDYIPSSPQYRRYREWDTHCQRCGDCKPEPKPEPEKYHVHRGAWRATGKRNKFNQPTYEITCPNCGRKWISVLRKTITCRLQDGGCNYKFKR